MNGLYATQKQPFCKPAKTLIYNGDTFPYPKVKLRPTANGEYSDLSAARNTVMAVAPDSHRVSLLSA